MVVIVVVGAGGGRGVVSLGMFSIYFEPPLVHIDGQRNFNMASSSDVL